MTDLRTVLERTFTPDEQLRLSALDDILRVGVRRRKRRRVVNGVVTGVIAILVVAIAMSQPWSASTGTTRRIELPASNSELPAILRVPARPIDTPPAYALNMWSHTRNWFHLADFRLLRDDGIAQWYVALSRSKGQTLLCLASVQGLGAHASCTNPKDFARVGMLGTSSAYSAPTGQSSTTVSFFVPDGAQVFADGHPVPTINNLAVWYDSNGALPRGVQFVTPEHRSKREDVPKPSPRR